MEIESKNVLEKLEKKSKELEELLRETKKVILEAKSILES